MELWRKTWRQGVAPLLSERELAVLRDAMAADDQRLQQGATTTPPPLLSVMDWPCEGACAMGFCGWQGGGLETVGEINDHFARLCQEADVRMGEPAAVRWFLTFWDSTPRDELFALMLPEVDAAIERRKEVTA